MIAEFVGKSNRLESLPSQLVGAFLGQGHDLLTGTCRVQSPALAARTTSEHRGTPVDRLI